MYFHNLKDAVSQHQLAKYTKTLIIPNDHKIYSYKGQVPYGHE